MKRFAKYAGVQRPNYNVTCTYLITYTSIPYLYPVPQHQIHTPVTLFYQIFGTFSNIRVKFPVYIQRPSSHYLTAYSVTIRWRVRDVLLARFRVLPLLYTQLSGSLRSWKNDATRLRSFKIVFDFTFEPFDK